jgi:hypothetical protein
MASEQGTVPSPAIPTADTTPFAPLAQAESANAATENKRSGLIRFFMFFTLDYFI